MVMKDPASTLNVDSPKKDLIVAGIVREQVQEFDERESMGEDEKGYRLRSAQIDIVTKQYYFYSHFTSELKSTTEKVENGDDLN